MTEMLTTATPPRDGRAVSEAIARSLRRRYAAERRFKAYGVIAIGLSMIALATLLFTVISTGLPAFTQTQIRLDVTLYPQDIDPEDARSADARHRRLREAHP